MEFLRTEILLQCGFQIIFARLFVQSERTAIFAPLFEGIVLNRLKSKSYAKTYLPAIKHQAQKQTWFPQTYVND